ncbi:MAG TPA: hypothetical protein VM934_14955 [Pyrinomonadaceae bacterium]|nr:hypothetical protein [Pyrinomonadaceae bacterium]
MAPSREGSTEQPATQQKLRDKDLRPGWPERLAHPVGRFFSNLGWLVKTLAIYLCLTFATFLALLVKFWPNCQKPGFIAYEIATGGDPFNFQSDFSREDWPLWTWLLILHVLAWLIVPILIGTAADAAYRVFEDRRSRAERKLRRIIRKKAAEKLKLTGDALEEFIEGTLEELRQQSSRDRQSGR